MLRVTVARASPAGGEVQILNSGSTNNATVNKSLTISGGGHTVYLGTNIIINKAGAVVVGWCSTARVRTARKTWAEPMAWDAGYPRVRHQHLWAIAFFLLL
jgi:hypothetical protein